MGIDNESFELLLASVQRFVRDRAARRKLQRQYAARLRECLEKPGVWSLHRERRVG